MGCKLANDDALVAGRFDILMDIESGVFEIPTGTGNPPRVEIFPKTTN